MLLIAMHNKDSYLDKVELILGSHGIQNILRTKRDDLRLPITTEKETTDVNSILFETNFDKVVIASIGIRDFIDINEALKEIENSFDNGEKGFICTLPYEQIVEMVSKKRREGYMEISKHLSAKLICSQLQAVTKAEAINELASLMKGSPEINDFDQFVKDVFERETAMTTGIGHQIAIPHARTEAVSNLIIALGRSRQGIEFNSMDNQKVNLVFLIGTPKKDMGAYLRVLAYLTRLLKREEFRKKLLDAKDPEEMVGIFRAVEA